MHPARVRHRTLELIQQGRRDREIAAELGLPRSTVTYIRHSPSAANAAPACPRCWKRGKSIDFTPTDYSELLGIYLGDGCISRTGRVHRLRLALDERYPLIVDETRALLARSFPSNSIGTVLEHGGAMVTLSVYSSHLPCLFPQHGPGKKHDRHLELEPWQERIVETEPWSFLRGCIRTDGSTFMNRTGPYRYLTYDFRNYSPDIRAMFAWACDLVGLRYRAAGTLVRISRRESVARLVLHVGIKA